MSVKLLYPDRQVISEQKVLQWAEDVAMDNDDEIPTNLADAVEYLQDLGLITVEKF